MLKSLKLVFNFLVLHVFSLFKAASVNQVNPDYYNIPLDFWSKGVDKSKNILETILNKIKLYEGSETGWDRLINDFSIISKLWGKT